MLRIIATCILIAFYSFYLARLFIQKKQRIRTNQMGIGNKPTKVVWVERITALATACALVASVCSIFFAKPQGTVALMVVGILTGLLAVAIFAAATLTLNKNWRVGIPEEKTQLVTHGIYRISRNPAFVGFDLLHLSMCLLLPNLSLILLSLWKAVMLHLQILQEEVHLRRIFGEAYETYSRRTCRYLGWKRAG
jgi:protein-S-isoprenylcysteine O-methyltransferase Ste14